MPSYFELDEKKKAEPVFKVVDRRRFTSDGETRAQAPEQNYVARPVISEKAKAPEGRPSAPSEDSTSASEAAGAPKESRSSVDFLSFVASLATQAMAAMGLLPEAQSRGIPQDLGLAHEYMEIVAMLEERTQNNVSAEEKKALARLVNDLRLNFAEAQKSLGLPGR